MSARPESKVGLLLSTFQELITSGEMGANSPGAQVYVEGGKAAVVVSIAISLARDRLRSRQIVFAGSQCRPNRVSCRTALIFPAEKVVPKHIVPTLLVSRAGNGQPDSAARRPLEQSTSRTSQFCSSLPENLNAQIFGGVPCRMTGKYTHYIVVNEVILVMPALSRN
jgi:hypothetical protein